MSFFKKHREILLYLVFGVLTTAVNFIAFIACNLLLGEALYLVSNLLAWVVAVAFAFAVNKLWVFEARESERKKLFWELLTFVGARVFSLGVEELGLFLLVDCMKMSEWTLHVGIALSGQLVAKAILAVVVVIMNYFFSKFVIFRKTRSTERKI